MKFKDTNALEEAHMGRESIASTDAAGAAHLRWLKGFCSWKWCGNRAGYPCVWHPNWRGRWAEAHRPVLPAAASFCLYPDKRWLSSPAQEKVFRRKQLFNLVACSRGHEFEIHSFVCLFLCVCTGSGEFTSTVLMHCTVRPEKGTRSLGIGGTVGCGLPCWCKELNLVLCKSNKCP